MKTSLSMGACAIALLIAMPSAMAHGTDNKQVRTDRVSVSKGIQQFDINPFVDSKRVVRNDRVSYSNPKVEVKDESLAVQKHRFVRNDRVIVNK